MQQGPRLDAPGVLHHVMARGWHGVLGDVVDYVELLLVRSLKWRMLKTLTVVPRHRNAAILNQS